MNKEIPKTLSPQFILNITYYDRMDYKERETVFKAYTYNSREKVYILTNEKILTPELIDKLHI